VPGVGVLLPLEDSLRQTICTSVKLHKAGGAISALLEKYIDTASDKVVNIEQTLIVRIGKNEQVKMSEC
jgi:hypothetical protein